MSLIDHARRVAAKSQEFLDDLGPIDPADDAGTSYVQESLAGARRARDVLPAAALLEALGPAGIRRLQAPGGLGLVVQVPGPEWAHHVELALRGVTDFAHVFVRTGTKLDRPSEGNDKAADLLSQGARVAGVTHAPERYLPSALVAGADLVVRIGPPSNRVIAEVIRAVTGRRARRIPPGIGAALGFDTLTSCLRLGSIPKDCIARLKAANLALAGVDPLLGDIPALSELRGYGPAMAWAERLVSDLEDWREGRLAWGELSSRALISGPPGVGKSLLVRAIAKQARLPLYSTGVGEWLTQNSGYLNDVVRACEDVFRKAAAQAPAIIFLDEVDSVPNRISMDSRGKDYWTPLVNSLLTNLDSCSSGQYSNLIVIGATNHVESLDPALVRPGRLHPTIRVAHPSVEDLAGILRQHLGADLQGVDLDGVALLGNGGSGADATAWVKGARAIARAEGRRMVLADLVAQVAPTDLRTPEELRLTAAHEAAHCVLAHELSVGTISSVTIAAGRTSAGCAKTRLTPRAFLTKPQLERIAIVALAGRAMDALVGSPHTGAGGGRGSDLDRATEAVLSMHAAYGLGSTLAFRGGPREAEEAMRHDPALRRDVEADLVRLYGEACHLVRTHRLAIEAVAERLVEARVLSGNEVVDIVEVHRKPKAPKGRGGRHA